MSTATPAHKRVLLKLSGEAVMGDDQFGINRDTIEEQGGLNLYGYVGNDPVNSTDPEGKMAKAMLARMGKTLVDTLAHSRYVMIRFE